jgi:hypothetical protein
MLFLVDTRDGIIFGEDKEQLAAIFKDMRIPLIMLKKPSKEVQGPKVGMTFSNNVITEMTDEEVATHCRMLVDQTLVDGYIFIRCSQ